MPPCHAYPGVTHDFANLLPRVRTVAVDGAFGAGGLFFLESAANQAEPGVVAERLALGAKAGTAVVVVAIDREHRVHGAGFALQARTGLRVQRFRRHAAVSPVGRLGGLT